MTPTIFFHERRFLMVHTDERILGHDGTLIRNLRQPGMEGYSWKHLIGYCR